MPSPWIQFCLKPVEHEGGRSCRLLARHSSGCKHHICGDVYEAGSIEFVYVCDLAPNSPEHVDGHGDSEKLRRW